MTSVARRSLSLTLLLAMVLCCAGMAPMPMQRSHGCCEKQCAFASPPSAAIAPAKQIGERPFLVVAILSSAREAHPTALLSRDDVSASYLFEPLTTIQLRI